MTPILRRLSSAVALAGAAALAATACAPDASRTRAEISFSTAQSARAARRPPAAAALDRPRPPSRASRSPTAPRRSSSSASTSTAWRPARTPSIDDKAPRLPVGEPRRCPARQVSRPGAAAPLRDLPPRRRARRQAAHGPRRGAAVEPGAGQPLQHAARGHDRTGPGARRSPSRSTRSIPPIPEPADDEVHQAREDPERAADGVLGPADAPWRARPAAGGLRRASRGPLPTRHLPRPLPADVRRASARSRPIRTSSREYSERFHLTGYNRSSRSTPTSSTRTGPARTSRAIVIIEIQHANPYYDDSYAVNSENLGPYGDAITYELIPDIEQKYRGLGAGWARFLYGGSTGGWEALAAQVFYPDEYNGCFAACPDPIDFRAYTVVDIYEDKNAYYRRRALAARWPRPGHARLPGARPARRSRTINRCELVLGTKSRSGQQWDIWEAVYSPVGRRRLPEADLGQAHRRHRPRGRRLLARALRPAPHPRTRLGEARQEAARGRSTSTSATWTTTI